MAEVSDNVDTETFKHLERLRQLRIEHRDLDDVIHRLQLDCTSTRCRCAA